MKVGKNWTGERLLLVNNKSQKVFDLMSRIHEHPRTKDNGK